MKKKLLVLGMALICILGMTACGEHVFYYEKEVVSIRYGSHLYPGHDGMRQQRG